MKNLTLIFITTTMISSCTISFQNIATHGTATDLVDQEQRADADVAPKINLTPGVL